MPGPTPKDEKRRRNKDRTEEIVATAATVSAPFSADEIGRLNIKTQEYLAAICASPQTEFFQPTDWMQIRDLLILKDLFYRNQAEPQMVLKLSSEIRQIEAGLLFNHKSRHSAGVKIKPALKGEIIRSSQGGDDLLKGVF